MKKSSLAQTVGNVVPLHAAAATAAFSGPVVGHVTAAGPDGLEVAWAPGQVPHCEVVASALQDDLACGDRVLLLLPPAPGRPGIVVGRLAAYHPKSAQREVTITATESLVLRCGEASLDLRADGKVLLRGDDVLVRAKGTQRIRAGTVSIN